MTVLLRICLLTAMALSTACAHRTIYGKYRDCLIGCEEIELRQDGTFTYRVWGDLFGDTSDTGKWSFKDSDRGLISAEGSVAEKPPASARALPAAGDCLAVRVVDESGAPHPGARVLVSCAEEVQGRTTDATGLAELRRCLAPRIEIQFPGSPGFDQKVDGRTDLEVRFPIEGYQARTGLGLWLVTRGKLYRLEAQPLPRIKPGT